MSSCPLWKWHGKPWIWRTGVQIKCHIALGQIPLVIQDFIGHQMQGHITISGSLNAHFKTRRWDDLYELLDWQTAPFKKQRRWTINLVMTDTKVLDLGAGDSHRMYCLGHAMKEILSSQSKMQPKQQSSCISSHAANITVWPEPIVSQSFSGRK